MHENLERAQLLALAFNFMLDLSEEDRLAVMSEFCQHCGIEHGERYCQCWNDE